MPDQHIQNSINALTQYKVRYQTLYDRGTEHIAKLSKGIRDTRLFNIPEGDEAPLRLRIFGIEMKIDLVVDSNFSSGRMVAYREVNTDEGRKVWVEIDRIKFDNIGNIGTDEDNFLGDPCLIFFFKIVETLKRSEMPLVQQAFQ